jgi:hypothetical protein
MINSIHNILNFRSNYNSKWVTSNELLSQQQIEEISKALTAKPHVFKHFKVIYIPRETYINHDTTTNDVFCDVNRINNLKNTIAKYPLQFNNLVCAGNDKPLSFQINLLKEVRHLFKNIYYEAKDIECDWVITIPMGTNMGYMLRCGGSKTLHQINKSKNKTKLIGSAFGSIWPYLTNRIEDRKKLAAFTQNSSFIDNMFCNPLDYFEKLSDYKFFACPLGNGIQTPKICESILCETVPVVTNHIAHRELKDIYDLPLLIVDKWGDLTEEFLNESYESRFKHIDWQKEKSKFLVENFKNLLK